MILLSLITTACAGSEAIRKPVYKRGADSHTTRTARARGKYHVVRRGENLYRISLRYGVSITALKRLNHITDERDIKVGTKLVIPGRGAIAATPKRAPKHAKKTRRAHRHVTRKYTPRSSVRFKWPLKKVDISSRFGIRSNRKHDGIDLRAPKGTPIMASARGKVIFSGSGPTGYGNMIILKHSKRAITIYAHNKRNLAREGQVVKQGQLIAYVGRTGRATGYHLHFEIRINRKPVNPERYLPKR